MVVRRLAELLAPFAPGASYRITANGTAFLTGRE
jgi:hypothetical protein